MLTREYSCIPGDQLNDLREIGASDEQYDRVNANCKRNTDKELSGYFLEKPYDTDRHELSRPSLTVAVIGASGSGKSATGNTLLQDRKFKESSSATSETVREQACKSESEPTLTVIDTPGSWKRPKEVSSTVEIQIP